MKKYGILTAMKEEADLIITKYGLQFLFNTGNISFYENGDMVLVLSGIGKVQASIGTSLMIRDFSPEKLINIGIAGNADPEKIAIGDVVLVSHCIQHDIYLPFQGSHNDYLKKGITIPSRRVEEKVFKGFKTIADGVCLTGDQFIDNASKVTMLHKIHGAHCVEMEAFAFLSAARELQCLNAATVIKGISDSSDKNASSDHEANLSIAMHNSIKVLDAHISL